MISIIWDINVLYSEVMGRIRSRLCSDEFGRHGLERWFLKILPKETTSLMEMRNVLWDS